MKNLKYFIFLIILSFININIVLADYNSCSPATERGFKITFSKENAKRYLYIENTEHTLISTNHLFKQELVIGQDLTFKIVVKEIMDKGENNEHLETNTYNFRLRAKEIERIYQQDDCFSYTISNNPSLPSLYEIITNISNESVSRDSITCSYKGTQEASDYIFTCNVSDYGVNCTTTKSRVGSYSSLRPDDFLMNTNYDCNEVPRIYINGLIDSNKDTIYTYDINTNSNYCQNTSSEKCLAFNLTSSGNNNDPTYKEDFESNSICSNLKVKGAFRTLGWVIFALKIAVPIIIMIFGTIDFGKAVTAGKDEEIKKSAKSLIIRAICGLIIFLLPTILNFIISLFGGDKIYNKDSGTFGTCTYCMLNPTDSSCGNLMSQ